MKKIAFVFSFFALISAQILPHTHSLQLVQNNGENITSRILTPPRFKRIPADSGSFAEYIRNYPLKKAGSSVLLYNGQEKQNQEAHCAIFLLPLENHDFQQGAGSVIRFYAEYMYKMGYENKISFPLTHENICEWSEWRKKYLTERKLKTDLAGNLKKWTKYEEAPSKYEIFKSYIKNVLSNASPLSLMYESEPIDFSQVEIGDILFDLGKPNFVCLVTDVCKNPENNEKAVLLAQGSAPAQEFHIIKNPKRVNDPWYYMEDFSVKTKTPEHTYPKDSFRKLIYLEK